MLTGSAPSPVLVSLEAAALLWYQLSPLHSTADCTCRALQLIPSLSATAAGWHFSSDRSPGPIHGVFVKRDLEEQRLERRHWFTFFRNIALLNHTQWTSTGRDHTAPCSYFTWLSHSPGCLGCELHLSCTQGLCLYCIQGCICTSKLYHSSCLALDHDGLLH